MKRLEYRSVDKSTWGPGLWQDEPDKVQWKDEATGLPCLIVRGPHGSWCGYVGVPSSHPVYEMDYDNITAEVHGGLTYARKCQENGHICHLVENGEDDDVWWLGFDCNHSNDFAPGYRSLMDGGETYRDQAYVVAEVEKLAKQLKEKDHVDQSE
jgi:hypothetical protein